MKATKVSLQLSSFLFLFVIGMIAMPIATKAQQGTAQDTTEAIQDNSSAFNDSVQFDDMEPIFYEATEDEVEPVSDSGSGIVLYVGIAVVLLIVLILLKKFGKKKAKN